MLDSFSYPVILLRLNKVPNILIGCFEVRFYVQLSIMHSIGQTIRPYVKMIDVISVNSY